MLKVLIGLCLCIGIAGASDFDYDGFYDSTEDFAEINPASYMVQIMKKSRLFCLGTIFGETKKNFLVATNAFCASIPDLKVRKDSQEIVVDKIFIHPYYEARGNNYDIAVLKIKKPSNIYDTYDDAPNVTNEYLNLTLTQPSGNDLVTLNGLNATGDLKTFSVNATTENKVICRNKLAGVLRVTEKMVCVNYSDNISNFLLLGTPMIFRQSFAGVLSADNKNLPKIFTNIANSEIYSFLDQFF